jgi:hypothetical protein
LYREKPYLGMGDNPASGKAHYSVKNLNSSLVADSGNPACKPVRDDIIFGN